MKDTISINDKSFKILNKLLLDGFYEGFISPERIELSRKQGWSNRTGNYKVVGIANSEQKFELNLAYKFPMNIGVKIGLIFGSIAILVAYLNGYGLISLIFIGCMLFNYLHFRLAKKKEITLLTSKFLELYILEYET